jgi:hypothetical protein
MIRLAIGLVSLVALIAVFHPSEIARTLAGVDARYALLGAALYFCVIAIRVVRWQWLLRDLKIDAPYGALLRITMIGLYFNTFLPGGFGADAYRVYGVAQLSAKTLRPLAATLIERITGIVALTTVCLAAILLYSGALPFPRWILGSAVGAVLLAATAGLMMISRADRLEPALRRVLPAGLLRKLPMEKWAAVAGVAGDIHGNTAMYVRTYAIGLAMTLVVLACYWAIGRAIAPTLPWVMVAIFFPLIDLMSLVPVTVNGIGLKEGLAVFFLNQIGLSPAFSLSLSILYRVIDAGHALVGAVLFFAGARRPAPRDGGAGPASPEHQ